MNDCLFCKIIAGELPAYKVYEDDRTLAFLDIHPVNSGHTLVISKNHSRDMQEASVDDVCAVMATVHHIAPRILAAVGSEGYNLGLNNGRDRGKITHGYRSMKLLVSGGAGFIGSNFVRYVMEKHADCRVINFDKLTYAGNPENLREVADDPRYTFVKGDIADQVAVDALVEESKPDAIVNFAAETHVDRSIHGGLRDFVFANVMGPQVLCEATKKFKVPLFIQISTDEVYGSLGLDDRAKFTEETAFAPNMPYAACKAGGDLVCRSYFQTFRTPVIVTHCSNNYGPYQFPEKFIPQTIFKTLAEELVPIYGDGQYVRDWIHVRDHCAAIDTLLRAGAP